MDWDNPPCFVSIKNQTAELTVSALKWKIIQELCLKSDNTEIEETKIIENSFEAIRIDSSDNQSNDIAEIEDIYPCPKTTLLNKSKGKHLSCIEKTEINKAIRGCSISLHDIWLKYHISMSTVYRI